MSATDIRVAFACLRAAGTFRRLADSYQRSAVEYPKYAAHDLAEAERLKETARWHIARAKDRAGPRLPA